ncbi:MAG: IPT/TIG domain-containing protein [Candidatus Delongbacteria bacterium]|nr:IPT/TIG domain-containing protein [Candidatus Delongbacteria bacterium]
MKCDKDEITSRDYPRLKTLPVSEITEEGAIFNAEIIFRGDFEIINYGFVWAESENPTISNSERIIYSDNIQSNNYSETIETTLKENVPYFVRAFLETNDYIVYGENVSFISLGSKAPEIYSFSPTSGTWGDTINITGDNFSYIKENNNVELGELKAQIISSTDSTLSALVPAQKNEDIVNLKVSIFGNSSYADEKFNYLIPNIFSVNPINVTFGDTITITGENFGTSILWNTVLIKNIEAEIINVNKTKIEFIVPTELSNKSNTITLNSVGKQLEVSEQLTLKPPEISSFSPLKATVPNQIITIYGENFNPNEDYNSIQIKGVEANIINSEQNAISVELPDELIPYYNISVFDTVDIEMTIAEQSILSVEKLEIYWQSTWTKKNDFPGSARYNAVAFSIGEYGYFGTGVTEDDFELLNDFWKYDPSSDQWVDINDLPGNPRAGASAFTIGNLGFVGLGSEDFYWDNPDNDANHFKDFYSYNPAIEDWVRIADFSGIGRHSAASFAINSKGYIATGWWGKDDPDGKSKVTHDAWQYDPEIDSWTEIENFPNASYMAVGFNLNNKGYIYNYDALYEFRNNNWIKLSAPGLSACENIAFGINGYAYFGLGEPHQIDGTNLLYEYDPNSTKTTTKSISHDNKRWGASVFVIENKAYVIGGATYTNGITVLNDVWEFDPTKPEL